MTRNQLCELLGCSDPSGAALEVTSVTEDSRRVMPGALFVAVRGEHTDGHDHAEKAVAAGAVAIVGDRLGTHEMAGVPLFRPRRTPPRRRPGRARAGGLPLPRDDRRRHHGHQRQVEHGLPDPSRVAPRRVRLREFRDARLRNRR